MDRTPEAIVKAGGRQLVTGDFQSLCMQLRELEIVIKLTEGSPINGLRILWHEQCWKEMRALDEHVIGYFAFPLKHLGKILDEEPEWEQIGCTE